MKDLGAEEFACEDIDECAVSGVCGTPDRVSCYNTIGSYYCLCEEWYLQLKHGGLTC